MAKRKYVKNPALEKSRLVKDLPMACADEAAARDLLEQERWGKNPCCPRCGSVEVYRMEGETAKARGLWRCRDCKRQYTVRVGTIYEDSPIPLHKWVRAFWEASKAKNGISALELSRTIQVTPKSALFMLHRIRWAMTDDHTTPPPMRGTVEADETYVGGKIRKGQGGRRARLTNKQPVIALLERGGSVRTRVIPRVNAENLRTTLRANVHLSARLVTDQEHGYKRVGAEFEGGHETVNHSRREYVRGDVTTNGIEGFFARCKRSLNGTYHAVSREHLHRYLSQFEFAHNTRTLNDGERTALLLRRADGKRLTYREPVSRRPA